ncbi:MAG: hypothetical protein KGK08_07830 [Acidobacteriota bacterium]|nr:hypothetical protein [Acidobacteriota bacterium]
MRNYFNYFTEIEEHFQKRRGSLLMLSTLDWALIEMWREAGVPLECVLRGIDTAFDKYDAQRQSGKSKARKVNGLAWCAQSVMEATEQAREAALGAAKPAATEESGFEQERVRRYLQQNAETILRASLPTAAQTVAQQTTQRLRELAESLTATSNLEDLDRTLSVLEEQLMGALLAATREEELVALREQAARELAPYRGKMQAVQIKQVQQQFLLKRLMEANTLPRLSLFYMSHA